MSEVFGIVPKNTIPKEETNSMARAAAINNNIHVSTLSRTNANLIFRHWRDQTQPRQGPFKNPAIERVLLVAFRNLDAEGAKGWYLFKDGIPGEAIALACAAIDVCLEEYSQGVHTKVEFTTNSHRAKWQFYVNEWARLRDRDHAAQDYIKRLQSDLARQSGSQVSGQAKISGKPRGSLEGVLDVVAGLGRSRGVVNHTRGRSSSRPVSRPPRHEETAEVVSQVSRSQRSISSETC
ncbi:hypothetical protein M407DRAFT_216818 [Tulasnella calospora MUT 4182]|uniref:DUF6532 domain-containing protein n=1 Tax=Tulasnella calospora MUT 4182 TaxID=1051891 RepID=A0A0C3KLF2_9AGAM|nr:hypothetical protein M407DRAFT_216818 [Tulasnella calospora MUT 4182]